ncbi:MAG: DUF2442 domain-containing protein [Candidatus Dormibacteraeota bacterium]|nr:DUF2442 domain-containing protein [Candidatus Dormibacteraeota bacterium]
MRAVGDVDCSAHEWAGVSEPLRDPDYFAQVRVDPDAATVVWPNGLDTAPEPLYEEARRHPLAAAQLSGAGRPHGLGGVTCQSTVAPENRFMVAPDGSEYSTFATWSSCGTWNVRYPRADRPRLSVTCDGIAWPAVVCVAQSG